MTNHLIKINGKRVVKANIIWKRTNDSFGLLINEVNGAFTATVNTFNPDTTLDTTTSLPFQTFDGCLKWFERTLDDMELVCEPFDKTELGILEYCWTPRPKRWPNGDIRKDGES